MEFRLGRWLKWVLYGGFNSLSVFCFNLLVIVSTCFVKMSTRTPNYSFFLLNWLFGSVTLKIDVQRSLITKIGSRKSNQKTGIRKSAKERGANSALDFLGTKNGHLFLIAVFWILVIECVEADQLSISRNRLSDDDTDSEGSRERRKGLEILLIAHERKSFF